MINPGKLRNKIVIQQHSGNKDSCGQPDDVWPDYKTVWASIEPINGREFFAAQQINAEIDVRIRIRYCSGVKPSMRCVFGAKIYDIQSVIDFEERHTEMQLMCKELI